MKRRLAGAIFGAAFGVFVGSGTGIVGGFGGMSGVVVFTGLGAVIGFFATPDVSRLIRKLTSKG